MSINIAEDEIEDYNIEFLMDDILAEIDVIIWNLEDELRQLINQDDDTDEDWYLDD